VQDGWAKNPARDSTSTSHAQIRHLHLPSGGALRAQRRTVGDYGRGPAGHGTLCPALDAGTRVPPSAARVEMDVDCRGIRPADARGRLPGDEPKAVPGTDLGIRTRLGDRNCRLLRRRHGPHGRGCAVSGVWQLTLPGQTLYSCACFLVEETLMITKVLIV